MQAITRFFDVALSIGRHKKYIDDILMYSRDFQTHLRDLQTVFDRLRRANLKLHPLKCNWDMQKLNYLGFCLSSEGLSPDPKKTEVFNTFPRPKNQKDLRSFIGLASYYKHFISGFAKIVTSLHHLLRSSGVLLVKKHFNHEKYSVYCPMPYVC